MYPTLSTAPIQSTDEKLSIESINQPDSQPDNGLTTSYYQFDPSWVQLQDVIEHRKLNYSQGNILKVAFTLNSGRHSGTNYERDLNKLIWFANRELNRIN